MDNGTDLRIDGPTEGPTGPAVYLLRLKTRRREKSREEEERI